MLLVHPLRGALFETLVVTEMWKRNANALKPDTLYYYRDSSKKEVDVVEDSGNGLTLTEIKSGATLASDWTDALEYATRLLPNANATRIIYGGDKASRRHDTTVLSWRDF
jgi:predicted AAA+ superfamily ATPase